ncbi:hypothetical protein ACIBG8_14700 [Nonomuraea sp. NPDC050556]|uniref:hypothetical protein n=1 Tax=Nonomuraea sp. NPDC050556 TaxID=3364369 RepID=UPI00379DEA2F
MTEQALPPGDDHEVVRRGGHLAVVVPLEEYRALKLTHDWHHAPDAVRTTPEEFLAVSGLTDQEQQLLRERYGLPGSA